MKKQILLALTCFTCLFSYAQNKLTGKVYDENGKPLSGAFIFEKGSMNGTTSGTDGSYSISYKDTASVIIFSYVGYIKNQVIVEHRTTYDA
ncbi:MAG TPA: carboxypeptidase-like regulatory domain-containing protein, partial [Bacteroidia bacterium]|nr:carboxypeptidase-like regulatory domain-containing protein [Bacteroidia bacterium]